MNNNLSNNAVDKENAIGENIDEKTKEEKPIAPKMNTMTRKLVLSVVQLVKDEEEDTYKEVNADKEERNRVYKYLRDGMEAQNKALNEYMSALYIAAVADISKDDRKELNHLYSRISTSKLGSAYDKTIQFAKGLPAASSVARKAQQDFSTAMKKGLMFGTVALPTYRKDAPLLVHVDYVRLRSSNPHIDNGMYHTYSSHQEFLDNLYSNKLEVFIKFANGIIFKIVFGNPHKSAEIRSVIKNIFEQNYTIGGSSIGIQKGKIILNLTISFPSVQTELDENTVVGVHFGKNSPIVCSLNNKSYTIRLGDTVDYERRRTKFFVERRRLQSALTYSTGGHGRSHKISPDHFNAKENHWAQTYNHVLSRQIVEFAKKNKAKYIYMEDMTYLKEAARKFTSSDEEEGEKSAAGIAKRYFFLYPWSYFELQNFIQYKAARLGIEVRMVNPISSIFTCCYCGTYDVGAVHDDKYICDNPDCSCYHKEKDVDYSAAKSVSLSEEVQKRETKKQKKERKKKEQEQQKQKKAELVDIDTSDDVK